MIPSKTIPVLRLAVSLLAACFVAGAAAAESAPVNPSGFVIRRGTNLSHWLSQDFRWQARETWITANDMRFIARCGFDHVRLPVDEKELWAEDGTPNEAAFSLLRQALEWARASNLRVILDLHTVRSHHFNAANEGGHNTLFTDPRAQEAFLALWRQLSARLHDQPADFLAYEIMNEPVADNAEDWNKLVAVAHAAIRRLEPNRVLIIGSNLWQLPHTMPLLKIPAGDRNIILSTHSYSPLLFTHYTADWVPTKTYTGPVHYPGPVVPRATYDELMAKFGPTGQGGLVENAKDDWGPARLTQEFAPAIARARELGLQLYCGEFGCLPTVPRAERLAYYRDFIATLEQNQMAWANWEYKGDFGLFEWHREKPVAGAPDVELIDTLLAGAKAK
jgi:endoglucanase